MEGLEAIWPARARPRTDSRIVGSLRKWSRRCKPGITKNSHEGVLQSFPLHRHARVFSAVGSWAARLPGCSVGWAGRRHKEEPGPVRILVLHQ